MIRNLILIDRGERPSYYHESLIWHNIIVCTQRHTAEWVTGQTDEGHTVMSIYDPSLPNTSNWFLNVYKGYRLSYNKIFTLFDGNLTTDITSHENVIKFLCEATWWSHDDIPQWLIELGVKYPTDEFTIERIKEDSGLCLLPNSKEEKIINSRENRKTPFWFENKD